MISVVCLEVFWVKLLFHTYEKEVCFSDEAYFTADYLKFPDMNLVIEGL